MNHDALSGISLGSTRVSWLPESTIFPPKISAQITRSTTYPLSNIVGPLAQCVHQHPVLSAVIVDADSESPSFCSASKLCVHNHIQILSTNDFFPHSTSSDASDRDEEAVVIKKAIEHITNADFSDVSEAPPWKVYFVQLSDEMTDIDRAPSVRRYLVAYAYSHSHGDGASGLAFHQTFSQALQTTEAILPTIIDSDDIFWTCGESVQNLPPSLEDLTSLPITWSFLLRTIASEFLPRLPNLPFWSSSTPAKPWTGAPVFYDNDTFKTAVQTVSIDSQTLKALLCKCRSHGIKLTGLLDSFVAHSVACTLNPSDQCASVVGAIAIDLRKTLNVPTNQMGVMASVLTLTHSLPAKSHIGRARTTTEKLAEASSKVQDQPVGLLRYAGSLKSWHIGKIGKPRGESYEVSNIMVFDPICNEQNAPDRLDAQTEITSNGKHGDVLIENIFFAQPANVTGPALNFNVVSMKTGDLNVVVSWQVGALGLHNVRHEERSVVEQAERSVVESICQRLEQSLKNFITEEPAGDQKTS